MPALAQDLGRRWQFVDNHADAVACGDQIDLDEYREIIQQRGDDRRNHNLRIGHLQKLGHEKRSSAHDRWHELSAGRCIGFDRAGIDCRIAGLLHQRNCDHAGRRYIGDGAARYGAEQSRRDDGDFRCAAASASHGGRSNVGEEFATTGVEQYLTQQDEQHDRGCCNSQWRTEQGICVECKIDRKRNGAAARSGQWRRHEMGQQCISEKYHHNDEQEEPGNAAQSFHRQKQQQQRKYEHLARLVRRIGEKALVIPGDIDCRRQKKKARQPVIPGHACRLAAVPAHGKIKRGSRQPESDQQKLFLVHGNAELARNLECPRDRVQDKKGRQCPRNPYARSGIVRLLVCSSFTHAPISRGNEIAK